MSKGVDAAVPPPSQAGAPARPTECDDAHSPVRLRFNMSGEPLRRTWTACHAHYCNDNFTCAMVSEERAALVEALRVAWRVLQAACVIQSYGGVDSWEGEFGTHPAIEVIEKALHVGGDRFKTDGAR